MPRRGSSHKKMGDIPVYLTTHQVAGALGVSLPTVVNWIKAGRIDAHRTPGGHRRISRDELNRFADEFSYPLPAEFQARTGTLRVLVVDQERDFAEMVGEYLEINGGFEVHVADTAFMAGIELGGFRPHLVILDMAMGELDALGALAALRARPEGKELRIIACTPMRDPLVEQRVADGSIDAALQKPAELDNLLNLALQLTREI